MTAFAVLRAPAALRHWRLGCSALALALGLSACTPLATTSETPDEAASATAAPGMAARKPRPATRSPRSTAPMGEATPEPLASEPTEPPRDSDQQGMASWYGPGFHGRRTASGERFDREDLTAAHPSYAFGTRLCVRSAVTGKTVVVRVNDRGPHTKGRVIDLSQAAAEELGMVGLGIKPVEIWALNEGESDCPAGVDEEGLLDEQGMLRTKTAAPRKAAPSRTTGKTAPKASGKKSAASSSSKAPRASSKTAAPR